jgi:hypothetical protein
MAFNFKFGESYFNILSNNEVVIVSVHIVDSPSQATSIKLKRNDKLSDVRKALEDCCVINNSLLFSQKIPKDDDENEEGTSYEFSKILREHECQFYLKEIIVNINEEHNFIYLINSPDWSTLNKTCRLDYGCTMAFDEIKMAENRAFIMKDCELIEIGAEGYKKGQLEFETQNDWVEKTNLFFNVDANITNFLKLGLSAGRSQSKNSNDEIKTTYNYIELEKVSLKFNKENLELTDEFKNDIENAIKSKDPEEFKKITEKYGQFIATKVFLGGSVYFKNVIMLSENTLDKSNEVSVSAGVGPLDFKIGNNFGELKRRSKFYSFDHMRLLGGRHPVEDFNEKNWIKSLESCQNWDRIELQDPVSIFQLLPDDLRKRIFESIGKRILYYDTKDYKYNSDESGEPGIIELKKIGIPSNISKILLNKEAECNVFATVVDTEESRNDFFTCQILLPQNGKSSLIIHCIQRNIKKREYKLNIGIMIVGYDTNFDFTRSDINVQLKVLEHKINASSNQIFNMDLLDFEYKNGPPYIGIPVLSKSDSSNNSLVIGHQFLNVQEENKIKVCTFSYCLQKKYCVNLPEFAIHTLIISKCPIYKNFGIFKRVNIGEYILHKFFKSYQPKYISLYSEESYCGPIFPKQKIGQVKIKYPECVKENCPICKNKKLSIENIDCKFFDPYTRYLILLLLVNNFFSNVYTINLFLIS